MSALSAQTFGDISSDVRDASLAVVAGVGLFFCSILIAAEVSDGSFPFIAAGMRSYVGGG